MRIDRTSLTGAATVFLICFVQLFFAGGAVFAVCLAGLVAFLFYLGRTKTGCSVYLLLPILLFTTTILLFGVLRSGLALSVSALGAMAGIVLSMDRNEYISVAGVFIVGVSLSVSPVLHHTGAYVTLILIFVRLLLIPKAPRVFLTLAVLLPLLAIALLGDYRGGLIPSANRAAVSEVSESEIDSSRDEEQPSFFSEEAESSMAQRADGGFEIAIPEEVLEVGFIDSIFLFGFYTIILILVISVARKALREFKGWVRLVPPLMILVSVVVVLVGGFMYLRSLPLSEDIVFGTGGISSDLSTSMPSSGGEVARQEEGEPPSVETASAGRSFYLILRVATLTGIALLSAALAYMVFFITRRRQMNPSTPEAEEPIEEEVHRIVTELPAYEEGKEFIISAYQWLREMYFSDYRQLTPYELVWQTKGITKSLLTKLTAIYVPVKYGNRDPERTSCEKFERLFLELIKSLETAINGM